MGAAISSRSAIKYLIVESGALLATADGPPEDAGRQPFKARIGLKCSEAIKTELEVYQIENF